MNSGGSRTKGNRVALVPTPKQALQVEEIARPSTSQSTSSVRSSKLIESKASIIKKANDKNYHKKYAVRDRTTGFPSVGEFRKIPKDQVLESVLDKIETLSMHSYFTESSDEMGRKSSLFVSGKNSLSINSSDSLPSSTSQYQREYVEWKNAQEINKGTKQIAEAIKRKENHIPFGTFGSYGTGKTVYNKDFVTEKSLKKAKNSIAIDESVSFILNNPWDDNPGSLEEEKKEEGETEATPDEFSPLEGDQDQSENPQEVKEVDGDATDEETKLLPTPSLPPVLQADEKPQPHREEIVTKKNDIIFRNVTKPTDFDAASIFSASTHLSLYSRRSMSSTGSKSGIKGGKAKYMPRPLSTQNQLLEQKLRCSLPQISPKSMNKATDMDMDAVLDSVKPQSANSVSKRHNFPQRSSFNKVIRSVVEDDLLSSR